MTNRYRPTMESDQGNSAPVVKNPTLEEELARIARQNELSSTSNSGGFSLNLPSNNLKFQTYNPDYDAFEESFQGILDSYQSYRDSLTAQHATGKDELDMQLETIMGQIGDSQKRNQQAFQQARGTISEDAFGRQRALQSQMSARGLGGSGIEQLGNIQERMETGKQVSNVASAYYEVEEQLIKQVDQSQQNYNMATRKLNDSLQGALAQIMSQEASAKMDYTQQVQNLQRQVIADANQALQAQRDYELSVQSLKMQQAQFNASQKSDDMTQSEVWSVLEMDVSDDMKRAFMTDMGINKATQDDLLNQAKTGATNKNNSFYQGVVTNMRNAGVSEKEINAMIQQWAKEGVDVSPLLAQQQPSNTGGSTNPTTNNRQRTPTMGGGTLQKNVMGYTGG